MELKEYKLGDIAEISTGYPFDGNLYAKEGIRVLRGENIGDGILKWNDRIDKKWNAPFSKSDIYTLRDGDIVMQMDGNVGRNKSRVFAHDLPMLIAQRVGCIRAKKEIADQDFLYYVICSERYLRYINKVKTGTSIHHISLSQISNYTLSIPPLITQKRIADVLSSFDKQIALNKLINQNLEALARQLYDYWFVQFDFPDANGKPYKSSGGKMVYNPILKREIPEGWEAREIGAILDKVKSSTKLTTNEFAANGKYPIIDQATDTYYAGFTNREDAVLDQYPAVVFGDHSCAIKYVNFPFVRGADGTQVMISKEPRVSTEYLYFAVKDVKIGKGYARHYSFLKSSLIIVPSQAVALEFREKADNLLNQITHRREEILSLTKQRDELLPLLMNGQVNFDLSDD